MALASCALLGNQMLLVPGSQQLVEAAEMRDVLREKVNMLFNLDDRRRHLQHMITHPHEAVRQKVHQSIYSHQPHLPGQMQNKLNAIRTLLH